MAYIITQNGNSFKFTISSNINIQIHLFYLEVRYLKKLGSFFNAIQLDWLHYLCLTLFSIGYMRIVSSYCLPCTVPPLSQSCYYYSYSYSLTKEKFWQYSRSEREIFANCFFFFFLALFPPCWAVRLCTHSKSIAFSQSASSWASSCSSNVISIKSQYLSIAISADKHTHTHTKRREKRFNSSFLLSYVRRSRNRRKRTRRRRRKSGIQLCFAISEFFRSHCDLFQCRLLHGWAWLL